MTTQRRYSGVATLNHWLAALLIIAMLVLGLTARYAPERVIRHFIMDVHVGLGFFVLLFIAWRVGFRLYEGFPPGAQPTVAERWTAWLVHRALLAAIALLVLTGPLAIFTEGEGMDVFGWFTFHLPLDSLSGLHEPMEEFHVILAVYVLPVLLGLHFLGAFRHYLGARTGMPADL